MYYPFFIVNGWLSRFNVNIILWEQPCCQFGGLGLTYIDQS